MRNPDRTIEVERALRPSFNTPVPVLPDWVHNGEWSEVPSLSEHPDGVIFRHRITGEQVRFIYRGDVPQFDEDQ